MATNEPANSPDRWLAQATTEPQGTISPANNSNVLLDEGRRQAGQRDDAKPPVVRMPKLSEIPEGIPGDFWNDFFSRNTPPTRAVQNRVRTLAEAERFEHVVSLIEAALVNGQSQPWMYEILALSMEITGRPREEIERVVLSMTDFGRANYDSLVQSAKYLIPFDRDAAAMQLLKQASELDPDRVEAYLTAMSILKSTYDVEAAEWVLPGAVGNLWGPGSSKARDEARSLGRRVARRLQRGGQGEAAKKLLAQIEQAAIADVRVHLEWDGDADLDLLVREPNDTTCSHQTPVTPTGGRLLEDGYGPTRANEDYICPLGYTGDYLIEVHRSAGDAVGDIARLRIEVRQADGSVQTTQQTLNVASPVPPIRVSLPEGRRLQPQRILRRDSKPVRRRLRLATARPEPQDAAARGDASGRAPQAGAVGIAPQIELVSEGVSLQATPVVSPDRRYVRIGLQPWFQTVTDVQTFSFIGGQ